MIAALDQPRDRFLSEDYFVFSINTFDDPPSAEQLVARTETASRNCCAARSSRSAPQERDEVLRHRISYLADDLVVPTWSSALVYDTESGVEATLDILDTRIRSCSSSAITTSCSTPAGSDLQGARNARHIVAGGRAATPARRDACTRCSSTSTS